MLLDLGVPLKENKNVPVMAQIRNNINELCVQLVGKPLSEDIEQVTLAQLIQHMQHLNNSVSAKPQNAWCLIM